MYYYEVKDNLVYKFEVVLDLQKLHKIKNEIIDNCSVITHKRYETTNPPKASLNIKNYKKIKLGMKTYGDTREDKTLYLVDYDYHEYSPLANYIVDLILGDVSAIYRIRNFKENVENFDEIIKTITEEQQQMLQNLNLLDDMYGKLELMANKRREFLEYTNKQRLNEDRVCAENYKDSLLECITFKEVKCMPIEKVLEVEEFIKDNKQEILVKKK